MLYDLKNLLSHVQYLENAGLYRRALRVWQDIATHPGASDSERVTAWDKITSGLGNKEATPPAGEPKIDRRIVVAEDKKRIAEYLSLGYSSAQICGLTGRSRSFVASCRKSATR